MVKWYTPRCPIKQVAREVYRSWENLHSVVQSMLMLLAIRARFTPKVSWARSQNMTRSSISISTLLFLLLEENDNQVSTILKKFQFMHLRLLPSSNLLHCRNALKQPTVSISSSSG